MTGDDAGSDTDRPRTSEQLTAADAGRGVDPRARTLPGRFSVDRVLGEGGMGLVVQAYDRVLGRDVAIKILALEADPLVITRFLREARAVAPLRHRGIVQVYDTDPDGKFIVMELVRGESLSARLDREGRLPAPELRRIGRALAESLAVAHAAGIVHRDVKPANVLLDESGDVKLADFGVAWQDGSELTRPGTMIGTPAYMAPEQLRGSAIDARADVYAAGATLFKAATGMRLHERPGDIVAILIDATGDPALARVIERAVRELPGDRFADGQGLVDALDAAVVARRTPRTRTWVFAAVLAAVGGAFVISRWPADQRPAIETADLVAIAPVVMATSIQGDSKPDPAQLAELVEHTEGAVLHATSIASADLAAAKRVGASYLLEIQIAAVPEHPRLTATVTVRDVATGAVVLVRGGIERPTTELGELQYDTLGAAVAAIAPGAKLRHTANLLLAQKLTMEGLGLLRAGDVEQARTRYEQAIAADSTSPDAWQGLAIALAWGDADEELVVHAADRALELTPPGGAHELMRGISLFLGHQYREARRVLEALEASTTDQHDELMYFLGEVNWHDGRFDDGYRYFERAIYESSRSRLFAVHPVQYLIARRKDVRARFLYGIAGYVDTTEIEFSIGHYQALAAGTHGSFRIYSKIVLDLPITDHDLEVLQPMELAIQRVARAADLSAATVAFDDLWKAQIAGRQLTSADYYLLEWLGEVVISAGMADQARRVLGLLVDNSKRSKKRGYLRFASLTAAMAGDPSLVVRDGSERDLQLVAAADAELAGDHALAASLLAAVVANPSYTWDYPERAALIRNLKILGRTKDIALLCNDTLHPAIFRYAYQAVRRSCREAGVR